MTSPHESHTTASSDSVIGSRLKPIREAAGFTQDFLADQMQKRGFDFTQSTVYKIETGKRKVTVAEAMALSEILESDIYALTATGEEEAPLIKIRLRTLARNLFTTVQSLDSGSHIAGMELVELEQEIENFESKFGKDATLTFGEDIATPRNYFHRLLVSAAAHSPSGFLEDNDSEQDFELKNYLGLQSI